MERETNPLKFLETLTDVEGDVNKDTIGRALQGSKGGGSGGEREGEREGGREREREREREGGREGERGIMVVNLSKSDTC